MVEELRVRLNQYTERRCEVKEASINENVIIEVYKEHAASWKHEDNILYRFGAFMVPTSFAILGVPYIADIEGSNLRILEIMSTIGGLILMTFWVSYVCASHAKVKARLQIINDIEHQIERDWGIKGHKDVPDIRDKIFGEPWLFQLRTHFLEKSIFYVYWGIVVILTAWRFCGNWKSLAIAYKLLVVAIIGFSLVIALRYDCRIRRGEKNT